MNAKTDADLLFETYLRQNGRQDFLYEARLPETLKVPDYQLPSTPKPLLFEVKGFDAEIPHGCGYFDPYPPLRRKITKAAETFKNLGQYPCSLVLHYAGPGLIFLDPPFIFGAMLGEVAIEMPFDHASGTLQDEDARRVFSKRGRMIQYGKGGHPEKTVNTTINAIVVVEHYPLGQRRFGRHYDTLEAAAGRRLTTEECWREVESARGTERDVSLQVVRAVVHENPYARIPLSRDTFAGPYDERYGADDEGRIVRLYAGDGVAPFEAPAL
jgi:hypothetical protein